MAIVHKFIHDLIELENRQLFCGRKLKKRYKILVIGTFNPSDASCTKANEAEWFYGRNRNKFWRYLPTALHGQSLHPADGPNGNSETWKQYCRENNIIIIDLIKRINITECLPNFGDRQLEYKINGDLSNTDEFKIERAFRNVTFERVIYSLKWSDRKIVRLKRIRDNLNEKLIAMRCVNDSSQIKYCKTPSRNDAYESWANAINN